MHRARWRRAPWWVWGLLALSAGAAAATDETRLYAVNVPPGPLHDAIDQLAAYAHLQVLYDPAVAGGRLTRGVKGSMTLPQAFEQLLAATDVAYQFTAADTVALYRKPSATVAKPPPPPATVPMQPVAAPQAVVQVTALRTSSTSVAGTSLTAMKSDVSVLATPMAFESVTEPFLEDRQADRVEDVLEGVSGIEIAPDGQDTVGFVIRGIPVYQYYVDGVRVSPDLHHDAYRDLADVASIDVVKGPASTLYGRTEPGGLINIVTKQPLSEPYFSTEQQVGSFERRRTQLDAGGPLDDTGTLLYRFNAAWEAAQSYRQDASNRRFFLAPVVTWNLSPLSSVTGYLECLRSDDPTDSGLPIVGASIPGVPVGQRLEDGGEVHTRDLHTGVRGWHVLDDQWTVRYHFDGRWLRTPQSPQLALADDGLDPAACTPGACPVDQLLFSIPVSRGQTYFSSLELLGELESWGARHAVLFGSEFFDVHGDSVALYRDDLFSTDLYSPHHVPVPRYLLRNPDWAYATWTSERWNGLYLQDQVQLGRRVYVLLGVRYDHAREWLDIASGFPLQDDGKDMRWDHAFKRHAGIVWRAAEPLSLYANYAENFGISTGIYGDGTGGTGTLVPPETAHEWEVGAKASFLDGRLNGSLAWFDLTELNISLPAFSGVENAEAVRVVTGTESSRGVELDVRGEILPNVQLLASYAFLDTRILRDAGSGMDTGNRLFGTPRHGGSAWVSYRPRGMLQGLKLGLGTVARTWREGDNQNDYRLPGFVKWGALARYEWPWARGQLALQLNVDNLFNTRYFESISGTHTIMPAAPRHWLASIRWTSGPRQ